jgi:protochlorophyllide reductase
MLTQTELPQKLYFEKEKEMPKVLGGLKIGLRQLVVITGASSGLGLNCAVTLAKTGKYFVVMACRDVEKAKKVAKEKGMPDGSYVVMKLELGNLQSVRDFVANLKAFKSARPLNHLICNAAVYKPKDPNPAWTDDGFEMSMGVNHLGHFLLVNLLLEDMSRAKGARVCIVGSITGNTNTVGGGLVYPQADLGNLKGMELGMKKPISMADGKPFFGAKAYKDSKVCNMMTVSELHRRYHEDTGIVFSSMYPGCIAETALFREKREWFRKVFPWFMKYVTGGYVSQEEAGERLAQVIDDPSCAKSGVYWSWNGGAQTVGIWSPDGKPRGAGGAGGEIFENTQSDAVRDLKTAQKMWKLSKAAVGLTNKEMYKGGKFEEE